MDGHTTIANELMENSRLKTATRGVLNGARVVEEAQEEMPDGSILARVLVRLTLYPAAEESTSVVGALLPTDDRLHQPIGDPFPGDITNL